MAFWRKSSVAALIVSIVTVLVCIGPRCEPGDRDRTVEGRKVQQWEHKVILMKPGDAAAQEKSLNELGASGWKLVTTEVSSVSGGIFYLAYLERPKQ
jgi:hypothetical protein